MRAFIAATLIFMVCSCSKDTNNSVLNPEDSVLAAKLAQASSPVIQNENLIFCGMGEAWLKSEEKERWTETFKQRLKCENYLIKRKNFFTFIKILNKTDSFSIPDFKTPNFFEDFEKEQDKAPLRSPMDSILHDSTWVYFWYDLDYSNSIWIFPTEIFILKTGQQDSVPLKLQFNADYEKNITMTLCTDSFVSKKISKILIEKHLAIRR